MLILSVADKFIFSDSQNLLSNKHMDLFVLAQAHCYILDTIFPYIFESHAPVRNIAFSFCHDFDKKGLGLTSEKNCELLEHESTSEFCGFTERDKGMAMLLLIQFGKKIYLSATNTIDMMQIQWQISLNQF